MEVNYTCQLGLHWEVHSSCYKIAEHRHYIKCRKYFKGTFYINTPKLLNYYKRLNYAEQII